MPDKPNPPARRSPEAERKERLAAALRENLRKRKAAGARESERARPDDRPSPRKGSDTPSSRDDD